MPTIKYSARSARLSVHRRFTSCIRRGLVWRDSIVDGDWLPTTECMMSALFAVLSTRIRRVRKIWEYVPCTDCTGQGNDCELIPTVKNGTRNPVDGYFGSEFPAICNHCGVMVAWSCKTLKIFEKCLRFLEKRPRTVKFSKFCSESFHCDTVLCSNFVKFGRREIGEIVRCLSDEKKTKFRLDLHQLSLLRGSRPKSARASPR